MKSGSILASGTAQDIKENEVVREHYLGKDFTF